jgi:hypothetical protein
LKVINPTLVGNGLDPSEWIGVDMGDPYSSTGGEKFRWIGDLRIDRNGQGYFAGATDVRLLGPCSAATAITVGSDTNIFGTKTATNTSRVWDAASLYSNASSNFTVQADAVDGQVNAKIHIAYGIYVRSSSGIFADGDYVDVMLALTSAVKYPNGSSGGDDIRNRHFLSPGMSQAFLQGVIEVSITNTVNGSFNLKGNTNRANTIWGRDSTDDGRGFISYRVIA